MIQILQSYEKTLDADVLPSEAYEHGEMLMYKAQVGGRTAIGVWGILSVRHTSLISEAYSAAHE